MSNDAVIRRVSQSFIPVAVNLYQVRRADDAGGELFRSVQRQKDQYQGIWIVSPEGRVLAGHHDVQDVGRWAEEVLATLDEAMQKFGSGAPRKVEAVERLPRRGKGIGPDGTVTLAAYTRYVLGGGRETAPADYPEGRLWHYDQPFRPDGRATIDSITLSADQWAAFSPPRLETGAQWALPEDVSARFYRLLSPTSDQAHLRGRKLFSNELRGRVESVARDRVQIRLSGQWETDHRYGENRIRLRTAGEGFAVFDVQEKSLQSLLLVCHGAALDAEGQPQRPTAAVVEWTREGPR